MDTFDKDVLDPIVLDLDDETEGENNPVDEEETEGAEKKDELLEEDEFAIDDEEDAGLDIPVDEEESM